MGVPGWNRMLAEEGWLPRKPRGSSAKNTCCTTSLWMDLLSVTDQSNPIFSERIVQLPSGSELHIDGFCLCFHLYSTAYARCIDRVLYSKQNHQERPCSRYRNLQSLTPQQVRHLLPNFVPLKLLSDVTTEFIQTLKRHGMELTIYWDGEKRHVFKQATDTKRQSNVAGEWSELHQFCLYGRMPHVETFCEWERMLPKTRLFSTQVMHSLLQGGAKMVFCDEEADHILAAAVSGRPNAYLVAFDSDMCFFPDCNYIPVGTLDASRSSTVTACVLRRDTIAQSLNLPDEEAMIELAILMGNDYVDPASGDFENCTVADMRDTKDLLDFLRMRGKGYRVTSSSSEVEEALRFVRMLYNLEDLSEFAFEGDDDEDAEIGDEEAPLVEEDTEKDISIVPRIPDELIDSELAKVRPLSDASVKVAVVRCLQAFVDRAQAANHKVVLSRDHLVAFQQLEVNVRKSYKDTDKELTDVAWRPVWEDVLAIRLIESIINKSIRGSLGSPAVRLNPPFTIFDQYQYHALLHKLRKENSSPLPQNDTPVLTPAVDSDRNTSVTENVPPEPIERPVLPVDEFENTILASVQRNRVTIIQGETGCGKSTKIPIFLLRASPTARLFISQPRRIAAKALVERLRAVEPEFRNQIALRMGHGVREYENKESRAWFVTTGYLVRLLANHPEKFDKISYLIIDEVHERSVDTDILCLLCRRLLGTNPHIRLVLMSATLASAMYQEYFNVTEPVIKVGARRFPVEEVYLDDLHKKVTLPGKEAKNVKELTKASLEMRCSRPPAMSYMEKLYSIVAHLATVVGRPGSSVLVFVPGMNDIVAITELVESLYTPGITYNCFPIHSDIPFDDQMHVFDSAKPDEIKIVIATNAAESSVTLPDVDHVICLGLCKQIVYNETSHRQMLTPTWISRASATQRAGRTGRVRPGTVYRMYARETYSDQMDAFEPGEMLRIPLDSVILMLKEMLSDEEVTEVLLSCLEPPNIATIDRSFKSLFQSHFITSPDNACKITTLGSFVSALGIDLALGSLIGLGIQFGVGAEAIQMASILSFPKTPFIMSNPLIHEPEDYNEKVAQTYASRCHFDANLFSEPLSAMNLVFEYRQLGPNQTLAWCRFHGIFPPRIKRLDSTCRNLQKRVADFVGIDGLEVAVPPSAMPHAMVTILRIIQVWVFHDTIIECNPLSVTVGKSKDGVTIDLMKRSDRVERAHLDQVLRSERHPYRLEGYCQTEQKGTFHRNSAGLSEGPSDFGIEFEARVLSYASQKSYFVVRVSFSEYSAVFVQQESMESLVLAEMLRVFDADCGTKTYLEAKPNSGTRRGIAERPCGMWKIFAREGNLSQENVNSRLWTKFVFAGSKVNKKRMKLLDDFVRSNSLKGISFHFPWISTAEQEQLNFVLVACGVAKGVPDVDLRDLLASPRVKCSVKTSFDQQRVVFPLTPSKPLSFRGENSTSLSGSPSWERPLLKGCIPEGARILSVLASGRRKEHIVRLSSFDDGKTKKDSASGVGESELLDLHLDPKQTNIARRWKRFNTNDTVYVETNSVPASAVPIHGSDVLYCCCANTLELRGGGLRAEGLTLLPPGKTFLLLCRFSFGLFQQENVDDGSLVKKAIQWIDSQAQGIEKELLAKRIKNAVSFHFSTIELEQELRCFPAKVAELLQVFDRVDGYECSVWDGLASNPFIGENLDRSWQALVMPLKTKPRVPPKNADDMAAPGKKVEEGGNHGKSRNGKSQVKGSESTSRPGIFEAYIGEHSQFTRLSSFFEHERRVSERLFASDLPVGQALSEDDLPSSNILAMIVQQVRASMGRKKGTETMSIEDSEDWEIYTISLDESVWFLAVFVGTNLPYVKRTSKVAAWLKQTDATKARPTVASAALECVPPFFLPKVKQKLVVSGDGKETLVFDSLELAVRMEACFWLERQFLQGKRHWYMQQDIDGLAGRLKSEWKAEQKRWKKENTKKVSIKKRK